MKILFVFKNVQLTNNKAEKLVNSSCLCLLYMFSASCLINFMGILPHPRIYNSIHLLISLVYSFTELYLSDTDNILPFENTTPFNQKKVKIFKNC